MQKISVLLPNPFGICTYFAEDNLKPGRFVQVPFGRTHILGVVWDTPIDESFPDNKIKPIDKMIDDFHLSKENRSFIDWVASYTLSPPGLVLKMALTGAEFDKKSRQPLSFLPPIPGHAEVSFSSSQQKAVDDLTRQVKQNTFSVTLLDGVTGSGKTEVYFEAIAEAIRQGRQALILLPEITLTTAWLKRFEKRFGVQPACWHSGLTPKTRRDTWQAVANGSAQVVVGARSALFLPFQNLGLIVVDEEHDSSYKQEDGVLYQARDMAVVRARLGSFSVILASATPSLETYCNVKSGRYQRLVLPERFQDAVLPEMTLVDMRSKEAKKKGFLSIALKSAIAETLQVHQQVLLFLNRRGYAPMRLCRACGEKLVCPHCSVFLTEHHHPAAMVCHQCGYTRSIPTKCPACGEEGTLISCGPGVERIAEEVAEVFPLARTAVITSDTVSNASAFEALCGQLASGEVDILIGTQMLAKGHNFPNLTLVGIVDADFGLSGGDLRASERTFQLLQQVSGRAGRSVHKGRAFIQTYSPQNLVIQALLKGDRDVFMETEIQARQLLGMPPFGRLAAIIISAGNEQLCQRAAKALISKAPFLNGVEFLGPVQAPIYQLRGKYRWRILVKSEKTIRLQTILTTWLAQLKLPSSVTIRIDIDPYSFF